MLTQKNNEITAFIPSAGFGTRLMPLTRLKPKALVSFMGKPMLGRTIERLASLGITRFIVNVHHFADQMETYIHELQNDYDIRISDESEKLLDTGGGLYRASQLLGDDENTILVHNVDLHTQFNLQELINEHLNAENDITLAVSDRRSTRKLLFQENELCGWKNIKTSQIIKRYEDCKNNESLAFSGIHLVNKAVLKPKTNDDAFPLIPWYLEMDKQVKIAGWKHNPNDWFDLGTITRIEKAEKAIINR